jgi:hypothetical protein
VKTDRDKVIAILDKAYSKYNGAKDSEPDAAASEPGSQR